MAKSDHRRRKNGGSCEAWMRDKKIGRPKQRWNEETKKWEKYLKT